MSNKTTNTDKISQLVQGKQFFWWLGHVCVILNATVYFSSILSFHSSSVYYRRAYMGALLSYAIVIYNSIGNHKDVSASLLCDENVHYFLIALYWYSTSPIAVTLIPFFIYSLFHALNYTQTTLIPLLIPEKEKGSLVEKFDHEIKYMTRKYHIKAMQYAAHVEVILIPCRLMTGVLMLYTSVLSIIVFIHFLRLRYYLSNPINEAIENLTYYLDRWLLKVHSSTPLAILSKLYINLKRFMIRYASSHVQIKA